MFSRLYFLLETIQNVTFAAFSRRFNPKPLTVYNLYYHLPCLRGLVILLDAHGSLQ